MSAAKQIVFGVLASLALFSAEMFAQEAPALPDSSPEIRQGARPPQSQGQFSGDWDHAEDEILVRFKDRTSAVGKASAHSAASAAAKKRFNVVRQLELVKLPRGVSVENALNLYRSNPDVLYAEPNYAVQSLATPNDPLFGQLWGLQNTGQSGGTVDADIDAPGAWDIATGSSAVVVAVIDTGIDYNHPALSANMFQNSVDCNADGVDDDGNGFVNDCYGIDTANNDSNPLDDNNHGTHVAGTIGAVGDDGVGVVGVNWDVSIMACKFLSAGGSGFISDALDCLNYIAMMKDRGVNIVATNNSWGGGGFSQAFYDAIDAHRQRGILFIAAAGNAASNNDSIPFYPAGYYLPNVISVAATNRFDGLAYFSNYGRRTVHLGAPGQEIVSTTIGNTYSSFSGTSMATPHVTGLAALLKAQDPSRDWRAIKNLILAGGDDNSALANTIAQKRLNAQGSLACSNAAVFSRLKPVANVVSGAVGTPIDLAALNILCADPNGDVAVSVSPGGQPTTLLDDGAAPDQAAGDGIYSGRFTPSAAGTFTLTFPGGDVVTVNVQGPLIGVTPNSQDFGAVVVGGAVDRTFTVQNVGVGTLSGSASTSAPFSVVAGGSYSLGPSQSQAVTVRFTPDSLGTFVGNVAFTGGGDASKTVTGVGATRFALTLTKAGSGSGTVSSNPAGVSCGSDCSEDYTAGTVVSLTATPAADSVFAGWSGACSGTGACMVTVNADSAVTASFTKRLNLIAPNGGESWVVGSSRTIQWTSASVAGKIKILLSRDGGVTWKSLTTGTANDGSQSWKVSKPATTRGRIRICSVSSPSLCDTSDADFTIQ
jgi:hypothetical protein